MYETIIGLEIHIQLKTKSKMFCRCLNVAEGEAKPNENVCPVCMGHPGALPVINKKAVEWAICCGLALNCQIARFSKFDRKNYFYPDLPKGYQISQYDLPLCFGGFMTIGDGEEKFEVGLERIHLEEDAGKLIHPEGKPYSLVDFNRCGTPLLELVTKPDLRSPRQARIFLKELRKLVRYLGISDADMEKGQMRCDVNISLRPIKKSSRKEKFYAKTEIKNMNSFKAVEQALEYEVKRQQELWEKGRPPKLQTTRLWDEKRQITKEMRTKEEAKDYRYFPEPDLPPLEISDKWLNKIKEMMPEALDRKKDRFIKEYGLSSKEVDLLVADKKIADFFEQAASEAREWVKSIEAKEALREERFREIVRLVYNWLVSKLFGLLSSAKISIEKCKISPENFAELCCMIYENKISGAVARDVLKIMFDKGSDPSQVVEAEELSQVSDVEELESIVDKTIEENQKPVEDFKSGKEAALQFLLGQVMQKTRGKADPKITLNLLKKKLSS